MQGRPISLAVLVVTGAMTFGAQAFGATTSPARAAGGAVAAPGHEVEQRFRADLDAARRQLEATLRKVRRRADYPKAIERAGYTITAINADRPDYLEYEIVRGPVSHEVQLSFADGAQRASRIDVTLNLWQAEGTRRALSDPNWKPVDVSKLHADPGSRYSDSKYIGAWRSGRQRLRRALWDQRIDAIRPILEGRGYTVRSIHDFDGESLDYDVVRGDNRYDVHVDVDPATQRAADVDVTWNLWDTNGPAGAAHGDG